MIILGTDFGGTKIRVGAVDDAGRMAGEAQVPTEASRGLEAVVENLDRVLRLAAERAGSSIEKVAGIGVAAPGQIDQATSAIVHAPNLGWKDVPLGAMLRKRYGVPAVVENDVNAAAVGEARHGAGRGHPGARDVTAIFVGTGIGGGIVANGELVSGGSGAAGEVGHLVYRPGGEPCSCGERGHYESYGGGACVAANVRRLVAAGAKTRIVEIAGGDPAAINLGHIFEAAGAGDEIALGAVREMEAALGTLAANVVTLLNPALLVIGGGVVHHQRSLVRVMAGAVARLATGAAARACAVVESVLWDDAAVLGSAELVRRRAGGS